MIGLTIVKTLYMLGAEVIEFGHCGRLAGSGGFVMTEAQRRLDLDQALANTRIEGHEPSAAFLADVEAIAKGTMSLDQARAAALARALASDAAATAGAGDAS